MTPPVASPSPVTGSAAMQFTKGEHASLLEPNNSVTDTPPNQDFLAVTTEMQCEAAGFLGDGGASIPVGCK